jgi:hypothetical protein
MKSSSSTLLNVWLRYFLFFFVLFLLYFVQLATKPFSAQEIRINGAIETCLQNVKNAIYLSQEMLFNIFHILSSLAVSLDISPSSYIRVCFPFSFLFFFFLFFCFVCCNVNYYFFLIVTLIL